MMSRDKAIARAQEIISALAAQIGDDFVLLDDKTIEVSNGWVFFYNSREFIETGNLSAALVGNGPIFIGQDGAVHHLGSSRSLDHALKNTK